MPKPIFHRAELLLGTQVVEKLAQTRVIIFGVGGVGSWCAEALIRTGVGELTIVDSDLVCITNVNRQLQATSWNVGKSKVDELADRLRQINPNAKINAIENVYNGDTRDQFSIEDYDYVIDAIDSLSCKVDLLITCDELGVKVFSSMGAACKLDPTRIQVASIWKTQICPLAREVRRRIRKRGVKPDFLCVFSDEMVPNRETDSPCGTGKCMCPKTKDGQDLDVWCSSKAVINGSLVQITGVFGFTLASLVTQDVMKQVEG